MTQIVVGTGAGESTANSYGSLADSNTYWVTERLDTTWENAEDTAKCAALIVGTQYLDATYQWSGCKFVDTSSLRWPRSGALDRDGFSIANNTIPQAVIDALFELGKLALSGPLLSVEDRSGLIKSIFQKVDVLEERTEWMEGASGVQDYLLVDRMLAGLYGSKTGGATVLLLRV